MFGLDQRGVAVVTVVIVVVVSTSVGVATPVVVDVVDVDPDSLFYGLERLGEQIRMVGDEDQMKERCTEACRMYERGKAVQYIEIFEEFMEKAEPLVEKPDIKAWMEEHIHEVGRVIDVFEANVSAVNPDDPLYKFEISGELAIGVKDMDQAKERLGEYMAMIKKGQGKEYAEVMEKFREKFEALIVEKPVDDAERKELLEWMKEQKAELTEAQIELTRELLDEFKPDKIPPEIAELIKEKKERFEDLTGRIRAATTDEEREAAIRELKKAVIEQIERFKESAPQVLAEVEKCIKAWEVSHTVHINVKIEIEIGFDIDVKTKFNSELASLESIYEQHKAEMPEEVKELIEKLKAEALGVAETKVGLRTLKNLEDELEAWKEVGKAAYEEYMEKYADFKEKIESYLTIPECPEAIKLKIEALSKAVEEGDYEEAKAILEDLIRELMEWKPAEIPSVWQTRPM